MYTNQQNRAAVGVRPSNSDNAPIDVVQQIFRCCVALGRLGCRDVLAQLHMHTAS